MVLRAKPRGFDVGAKVAVFDAEKIGVGGASAHFIGFGEHGGAFGEHRAQANLDVRALHSQELAEAGRPRARMIVPPTRVLVVPRLIARDRLELGRERLEAIVVAQINV